MATAMARRALELLVSRPSLTDAQLRQVHAQLVTSSLLADRFLPNSLLRSLLPASPLSALLLFPRLRCLCSSFLPNNYTFSFLLTAAASVPAAVWPSRPHLVASLHAVAVLLAWDAHSYVSNGLIHAYASHGLLQSARRLFDHNVWCRDVCSWTSLLTAYAKAGHLQDARALFDGMPHRNAVSWSAMVSAYVGASRFEEAIGVFEEMVRAGVRPNRAAAVGALAACGAVGALEQGRWVHGLVAAGGGGEGMGMDKVVGTALVDMYGKCGSLETARQVFSGMEERDVFSYTAMISGLSDHGRCEEAIDMLTQMQAEGVRPNEVTFLCVLTACGRAGMVERAKQIWRSMSTRVGVEHYGSLVDVLGRAGLVAEAAEVVRAMPMTPDSYVLGALLKACAVHGDMELANRVAGWMAELGLDHSGVRVQLSNMHARCSHWDAVLHVRAAMDHAKLPGSSIAIVGATATT